MRTSFSLSPQSSVLGTLLAVSRGDAPADLVLKNGRIVNVFSGEIESGDIAIFNGLIAGIGSYRGREEVDLKGAFVAPGLIDAHVHIESSLCIPQHFASAVLPRGVTTVVTDPHEIANVAGGEGIMCMIANGAASALDIVTMCPSCVPATDMATSGAVVRVQDWKEGTWGLAEVMNFPGVINAQPEMLEKLAAFDGRPIDGHAPGVRGNALNAYIVSGIGSDHECVTIDEAREKLSRGLYILIREASNAQNLDALLPLINEKNSRRICFCTDDRQPHDLLTDGGIDHMLRRAIKFGIDPITAFRCCTLNTAEWFGLKWAGAIAPGRAANLFIFEDLREPRATQVYVRGRKYDPQSPASPGRFPDTMLQSCRAPNSSLRFQIPARPGKIRVIGARENQLITDHLILDPTIFNNETIADPKRDILKIAVIERHKNTGNIGLGFIHGIGLKHGAIAGTVAHDHHNLVVIGADDISMVAAAYAACAIGGGLVATSGEHILAQLPLPVAGLMSDRPIEEVRVAYDKLLQACKQLGSSLHDPFMAMSFMALEVIPALKLTDKGLVDVEKFRIVDLFV